MKRILALAIIALLALAAAAQSSDDDIRLAYSYYNNREYDKAAFLFEKLHSQSKSRHYFTYYINCLINTGEYDKAEKAAKKQVQQAKNDITYKVVLGYVYKRNNQLDKASEQYGDVVQSITGDRGAAIQASSQFQSVGEYDWAEKTLLKAQEVSGQRFSSELFSVYASSRNFKKMVDSGLDLANDDYAQYTYVQSMFQHYVTQDINDEFYDILRQALLLRIQKNPTLANSEMLIWLFVQKKNFKSASVQAKALDKRLSENGHRLAALADQALLAKDYAAALDCYKYVLSKGADSPYYSRANFGILSSMYEQVSDGTISDMEQIRYLESQYRKTFGEFGMTGSNIKEVINYAHLETYYLGRPDSASSAIESALGLPGITYSQRATLSLELGDIELFMGDVWAATMTYAKVENDNKQNEFGDEAKFRKARIAYYTGNFKWAASQLDVLKAATTKLVANDAMELSLLISDNADRENSVPGDTLSPIDENLATSVDLRIYARADMYFCQNQFEKAEQSLDSIISDFKTSGLVDEAYFLKAKISERKRDYEAAAGYFKKVADDYSYDILADKAAFRYAEICADRLGDAEQAKEYYMRILSDYPGSVYAVESREKYRAISGK